MQPSLPPCPECGGRQAVFACMGGPHNVFIPVGGVLISNAVPLYACTCLTCGHTVLRPNPADLEKLRKAAEQGKAVQF
jgi:hypothetical protein